MTQAFNLAQLANNLNTSGQLDATDGLTGLVANANLASSGSPSSSTYLRGDRTWASIATGKVLQVVQTLKTDTFAESLAANTNSSTNCIQVTITPTSSSSNILILLSITGSSTYWAGTGAGAFQGRLVRGSTNLAIGDAAGSRNRMTTRAGAYSNQVVENFSFAYLDSPATTSATTYGFRLDNVDNGTQTMYLNRSPTDSDSGTSTARTASSIIVMEIGA